MSVVPCRITLLRFISQTLSKVLKKVLNASLSLLVYFFLSGQRMLEEYQDKLKTVEVK